MCGVVSIVYGEHNENLGEVGSFLLKKLEYRGYDSTGGVFLKDDGSLTLKKKVGAPSQVTVALDMEAMTGRRFIGQVRWATYGAVTDQNAQPHDVRCHVHVVGAHNGNISNTDALKAFLLEHGHRVVSDNDGEMLVHLIEHHYHKELQAQPEAKATEEGRIQAFVRAIRRAGAMVEGSYAACITAPDLEGVFAIKAGSSLYAGKGVDDDGSFVVVSSDLTSVLAKTRFLIPLLEGQCLYFTSDSYKVYALRSEDEFVPDLTRSRLNIADIALAPKYHYFMEQEIFTSASNLQNLARYYFMDGDDESTFAVFEEHSEACRELLYAVLQLYDVFDPGALQDAFAAIREEASFQAVLAEVIARHPSWDTALQSRGLASEESSLLNEILVGNEALLPELYVLDQMIIWKKKRRVLAMKERLVETLRESRAAGRRVFVVASGTSYHAALSGTYFFNHLAKLTWIPSIPGSFRAMYLHTLRPGDLVLGISQSGETKDLVDIFTDLREMYGDTIELVTIVNNENSTLPQEKSDYYLPIMCGPEIAVAATKSFTSQLAMFYILAASLDQAPEEIRAKVGKIQYYMDFSLKTNDADVSELALKLFLKPSLHILGTSLAGLSKEAALKIREVVLNHTEGYDGAEFKHGPNTLLGKNTTFSLLDLERLHTDTLDVMSVGLSRVLDEDDAPVDDLLAMLQQLKTFKLKKVDDETLAALRSGKELHPSVAVFLEDYLHRVNVERAFSNYPLLFVCLPNERDRRITISQIHTHKIRGADIMLVAEEDPALEMAVAGKPAGLDTYDHKYIKVPATGDPILFHFQVTILLQYLAFKMSVAKMKYLNALKVEQHGVHPDVPKNVSKSITVD